MHKKLMLMGDLLLLVTQWAVAVQGLLLHFCTKCGELMQNMASQLPAQVWGREQLFFWSLYNDFELLMIKGLYYTVADSFCMQPLCQPATDIRINVSIFVL